MLPVGCGNDRESCESFCPGDIFRFDRNFDEGRKFSGKLENPDILKRLPHLPDSGFFGQMSRRHFVAIYVRYITINQLIVMH